MILDPPACLNLPVLLPLPCIERPDQQLLIYFYGLQFNNASQITLIPTMFLTKLSLLLFYLPLFTTPNCRTKTYSIIRFLIVFLMLFYLTNLLIAIWPCIPRSKLWTPTKTGNCVNYKTLFITSGTINTVADFVLLLLPLTQVQRQPISRRRGIGVTFILVLGLLYVMTLNSSKDETKVANR